MAGVDLVRDNVEPLAAVRRNGAGSERSSRPIRTRVGTSGHADKGQGSRIDVSEGWFRYLLMASAASAAGTSR